MTEARDSLAAAVMRRWCVEDDDEAAFDSAQDVTDAILTTTDALAVLLDPETMLRAWEKAGKVVQGLWSEPITDDLASRVHGWGWRIVPDEEGARDE